MTMIESQSLTTSQNHTVTITIMTIKQFHNSASKTYNHKCDSDIIPQPDRKSNHTTTSNYIYNDISTHNHNYKQVHNGHEWNEW